MKVLKNIWKKSIIMSLLAFVVVIFSICWIFFGSVYFSMNNYDEVADSYDYFRKMYFSFMTISLISIISYFSISLYVIIFWFKNKEKQNSKYSQVTLLVVLSIFIPFASIFLFWLTDRKINKHYSDLKKKIQNEVNQKEEEKNKIIK